MTPDELAALTAAGWRLLAMLEEDAGMSDDGNTIAVTYDRRHGANVYLGDRLRVTWEGQEIECVCTGWNAPPDGKVYVKTDQIFGDWSNKVESSLVRIVLTPREARLQQQAAAGEALAKDVEYVAHKLYDMNIGGAPLDMVQRILDSIAAYEAAVAGAGDADAH